MSEDLHISICRSEASLVTGGPLEGVASLLSGEDEVFLVYDAKVAWVASDVLKAVQAMKKTAASIRGCIAIETGEPVKNMETVLSICRQLMDGGASRGALVLAVGGGITTDMAGFASCIYKRGMRYANLPTTLLSQVDAAVGGKTGVNMDDYKNMLGVIAQPQFTYLCPEVLRTLPEREFRSGAAEMLKTFLIDNGECCYEQAVSLLSEASRGKLSDEKMQELSALILAAAKVKAGIVSRDPFEGGERRKLNLGHTFAHAIEHEARRTGTDISHGEAVAIGILLAARLSEATGVASRGFSASLTADWLACGLPAECPFPLADLAGAMTKDKKAEGEKIHFVLPREKGDVIIRDFSAGEAVRHLL